MATILLIENAFILLIISLIHFYWGFGGRWGMAQSLPTNEAGEKVLNPGAMACFIVAFGLLAASFYCMIFLKIINFKLPNFVLEYGIWALMLVFSARAIGDFKYVGFGKKITTTHFADLDSRYYSPLCAYLAVNFALILFSI